MFEREGSPTPEPKKSFYPITLIVPSSGLHLSKAMESGTKLSWDARERSNAVVHLAKELIRMRVATRIIVCGGEVYRGYLPLAELMEEDIRKKLRSFMEKEKVPEEAISISRADEALNTVEEIDSAVRILKEDKNSGERAIVISNAHHLVARVLSRRKNFDFFSAETILRKKDKRYNRIVCGILFTPELAKLIAGQVLGSAILLFKGEEEYRQRSRRTLPERAKIADFDPFGLPGKKRLVIK